MQHWVLAAFLACALAAAAADAYVIAGAGRALAAGRFPRVATRTPLALRGGAVGGATMMGAATNKIIVKTPSDKEKETASNWPTWGCGVSKFPWSYDQTETCLVLEGECTVTPDGGGEPVQIKAGDMAVFPQGMSCTWDVTKAIKKHYNFE